MGKREQALLKGLFALRKRPFFWVGALFSVICFFPVGLAISALTLLYDLKYGQGWKDFKKDGLYTPFKTGYYMWKYFLSAFKRTKTSEKNYKQEG